MKRIGWNQRWRSTLLAGLLAALLGLLWAADAWAADPSPQLTFDIPPGSIVAGQPLDLDFRATNNGADATNGSITVSVSGADSLDIVDRSLVPDNDASYARILPPGTAVFNRAMGTNVASQLPAAELFVQPWPAGTTYHMRVRIVATGGVTLYARSTLRSAAGALLTDPSGGPADQQGFSANRIQIPLAQAPPPPTNTPVPEPTPVPPTPVPPAPTAPPPVRPTAAPARPTVAPGLYVLGRRSASGPSTRSPRQSAGVDLSQQKTRAQPLHIDEYGELHDTE